MARLAALGIVLASVLVPGVVAGLLTGRWGSNDELDQAVARLDRLPGSLGEEWDIHPSSLSERELDLAEAKGHVARKYVNRRTGAVISVLLLCGPSGAMAAHTPEVCYVGAGFAQTGATKTHAVGNARFRVVDFLKTNAATPTRVRVFLSWGHGGEWSAPAEPRFAFPGKSHLYKLYVVREMAGANEPIEKDAVANLLEGLLPQLQEALFAGP